MSQQTLFDLMRDPMIVRPVDIDGHVVKEPQEIMEWGNSNTRKARIELHQASDGKWMWSTAYEIPERGSGYRVGEKWGRFAASRGDALYYAVEEMRDDLAEFSKCSVAKQIIAWTGRLS